MIKRNVDQLYSGIASGRVLNKELYAHRIEKSNFVHLFTDLFREDFSPLFGMTYSYFVPKTYIRIDMF